MFMIFISFSFFMCFVSFLSLSICLSVCFCSSRSRVVLEAVSAAEHVLAGATIGAPLLSLLCCLLAIGEAVVEVLEIVEWIRWRRKQRLRRRRC